jgi:hypothetical protein
MVSNYIKDTKKYWQVREKSRITLDLKRSSASPSDKARETKNIASDVRFLKTGRVISSTH